ncbi:hypothetical protein DYI37_11385 [Fulvimarina endophytica]|uniref:DNA circulation N-terminal domain-containing protein n=1 Tax=Fulvimarina endophytica TaxID=2293836 RepID=A0A371X2Z2_9HYPH|nr:DNA circularization N-terminal domain-containing protein [Fulvimarina endophytica]RFC63601.1 hypothetical protein DYI37_11385 [Fulvimarina endophytica]
MSSDLLPGLIGASYRGIGFDMPDTRSEAGRRIQRHLFPGRDQAAYDDFGKSPNVVSIEGVILGDDYITKAHALEAAFAAPGSARLMHPWLGPMRVMMLEPGEISFSSRELRLARITATFERIEAGTASLIRRLSLLPDLASGLAAAATTLIEAASSSALSGIGNKAAQRSSRIVTQTLASGSGRRGPLRIAAAAYPGGATAERFAAGVATMTSAVLAATPALTAGPVGRAAEAPAPAQSLDARDALTFSLDLADDLNSAIDAAPASTDRAMLAGASGLLLSAVARTLPYTAFDVPDAAMLARSRILATSSKLADRSQVQASAIAPQTLDVARLAEDLGTEAARDLNEIIGRLPRLLIVERSYETDAFALSHHLYGDDPTGVEAGYEDIVARNRPRHPSHIRPGRIEAVRR